MLSRLTFQLSIGPGRFPPPNPARDFGIFFEGSEPGSEGKSGRGLLEPYLQVHASSQSHRDCITQPTGCEERATLGHASETGETLKGLNHLPCAGWAGGERMQPFQGW